MRKRCVGLMLCWFAAGICSGQSLHPPARQTSQKTQAFFQTQAQAERAFQQSLNTMNPAEMGEKTRAYYQKKFSEQERYFEELYQDNLAKVKGQISTTPASEEKKKILLATMDAHHQEEKAFRAKQNEETISFYGAIATEKDHQKRTQAIREFQAKRRGGTREFEQRRKAAGQALQGTQRPPSKSPASEPAPTEKNDQQALYKQVKEAKSGDKAGIVRAHYEELFRDEEKKTDERHQKDLPRFKRDLWSFKIPEARKNEFFAFTEQVYREAQTFRHLQHQKMIAFYVSVANETDRLKIIEANNTFFKALQLENSEFAGKQQAAMAAKNKEIFHSETRSR